MNKPIRFTRHARQRFNERWPGFKISDAQRILKDAEKLYDTKDGLTYYRSTAYEWILDEQKETAVVITMYKIKR